MLNPMRAFKKLSAILLASSLAAACERQPGATIDTIAGDVDSALRATIREYTDAELLGLLDAGEIAYVEASQLAVERATDAEVKAFATRLINEHKALAADVASAAKTLNARSSPWAPSPAAAPNC